MKAEVTHTDSVVKLTMTDREFAMFKLFIGSTSHGAMQDAARLHNATEASKYIGKEWSDLLMSLWQGIRNA